MIRQNHWIYNRLNGTFSNLLRTDITEYKIDTNNNRLNDIFFNLLHKNNI